MLSHALLALSTVAALALLVAGLRMHMPPVAADAEAQSDQCCAPISPTRSCDSCR